MAKPVRRTAEEVAKLVEQANALISGGKSIEAALKEVELAESVFRRHQKMNGRAHGRMDASSLPPRPKPGAKRRPRPLDLTNVAAVANRITRIDTKLATFRPLTEERKTLANRLMALLKK